MKLGIGRDIIPLPTNALLRFQNIHVQQLDGRDIQLRVTGFRDTTGIFRRTLHEILGDCVKEKLLCACLLAVPWYLLRAALEVDHRPVTARLLLCQVTDRYQMAVIERTLCFGLLFIGISR